MLKVFSYILAAIWLLYYCDALPVSQINFSDEWNYRIDTHIYPVLNSSRNTFLMPFYTFAKDLKIQALESNNSSLKSLQTTRESRIVGDIIRSKISCGVCNLGVGLLYREVQSGTSFEDVKAKFVSICVSFKIESFSVCSGIFDMYGPEVIPVMEVMTIGPHDVCKLIFGEVCPTADVTTHEWEVNIPEKPKKTRKSAPPPKLGSPSVFKVLQISDTHYDLDYVEDSVANCEEPLCCRTYSTLRDGEELVPAGRWGSYEKCDAPRALLENMLEFITLHHPDIDYILWTGDLPPHDIWNQTKQGNLNVINQTIEMVLKAFPNTPIFPAIGNHEASPAGNFAPPWMKDTEHSVSWLYNEVAPSWLKWLPEDVEGTVYHGAFYSVLLRPGFRLISVNTNYCHSLSWWLLVNSTDPAQELKWLVHELQGAEERSEKVHIIGHIAPGSSDCMKTWSKNFYNIINRYEDTVVALFYGHSHADEFELFYDVQEYSSKVSISKRFRWWKSKNINDLKYTGRPTAVAYLAPSVTSYTNYNPAFRIYYVDGDHDNTTREVLDHETWTFDLTTANLPGNIPEWYKLYSAKEAYRMKSLRPNEWNELVDQMMVNEELFDTFYRNYNRNSPTASNCDNKCRVEILCDLKSAKSHSRKQLCHELDVAFKA